MECIDEKIGPSEPEPEKMQVEIPVELASPQELNEAIQLGNLISNFSLK